MKLLAVQLDHGKCEARFFRDAGKTPDGKDHVTLAYYKVPRYMLSELEETLQEDYGLTRYVYGNVMHCNLIADSMPSGMTYYLTWSN